MTTLTQWPEQQAFTDLHQELFEEATRLTMYLGTYMQWFGKKQSVILWNLVDPQAGALIHTMMRDFLTLKTCALLEPPGTGKRKNRNFRRLIELIPEGMSVDDLDLSEKDKKYLNKVCGDVTLREHLQPLLEEVDRHYKDLKCLRDKHIAHRSECSYGPDKKLNPSVCQNDWAKSLQALEKLLHDCGLILGQGGYTVLAQSPETMGIGGGLLRALRFAQDYLALVEDGRITKIRRNIIGLGKDHPSSEVLARTQKTTSNPDAISWP